MAKTERQTITIDEVSYYIDSFPEEAQKLLTDINLINNELQKLQVQSGIATVAKNALTQQLVTYKDKFEVAGVESV